MAAWRVSRDAFLVAGARSARRPGGGRIVDVLRGLADALAICSAFLVSGAIYAWMIQMGAVSQSLPDLVPYATIALVFTAITLAVYLRLGLYHRRASVLNLAELETAFKGIVLAAAVLFALLFFLKLQGFSRIVIVGAIALSVVFVIVERRLVAGTLRSLQLRGRLGRRVLICGAGPTAQLLVKKIVEAPHIGYHVVGVLDDHATGREIISCRIAQTGSSAFRVPIVGRVEDWPEAVERLAADDLLIVESALARDQVSDLLRRTRGGRLRVGVVPHLEAARPDQLQVDDLSAIPVLRSRESPATWMYHSGKRLMDLAGAAVLLVVTAPIWLVASVLIALESGRPVFFAQERVGLNGRLFRMIKFRSMWRDVERYAPSPKGDVDDRITAVGRLLRTTGLDELPQLVNVLLGSMSLVGPRPEMPFIVSRYSEAERQRLHAKPGITGLWQLSADRHAEIHENPEYDLYYISHQSLVLDALILLETVLFTAGLVAKALRRRPAEEQRPAEVSRGAAGASEPYVLLAFDQRSEGVPPANWRPAMVAAHALAQRWPVVVPIAQSNDAAFAALLSDLAPPGPPGPHSAAPGALRTVRTTPYRGRDGLRALADDAAVVITDLPHVLELITAAGKDFIAIRSDGVGASVDTEFGRDVLEAFRLVFSFDASSPFDPVPRVTPNVWQQDIIATAQTAPHAPGHRPSSPTFIVPSEASS